MKMKKTAILITAMTALALGVSADTLDVWDMGDTAGTALTGLLNSGTTGTSFGTDDDVVGFTDGSGAFVVSGGIAAGTSSAVFGIRPDSIDGDHSLTMNLSGWDLTDAVIGQNLELAIKTAIGTETPSVSITKTSDTVVQVKLIVGSKTRVADYGLTGSAMILDVFWNIADQTGGGNIGATSYSWTAANGLTFSGFTEGDDLKKINFKTQGDWSVATTSISVDSMGYSHVIPEPATLGLVAAMGGGILFIRRRLMI